MKEAVIEDGFLQTHRSVYSEVSVVLLFPLPSTDPPGIRKTVGGRRPSVGSPP